MGSGTCEATAVTTRQWVGILLAEAPMGGILGLLAVSTFLMIVSHDPGLTDEGLTLFGLWLGMALFFFSMNPVYPGRGWAIRRAMGKGGGFVRASVRRAIRDADRNAARQLRQRGYRALFRRGRVNVRLGLGLVGVGVVLASLLALMGGITPSGETLYVQFGLLPTACLVGSLIALVGLLLSFPYGPSEKVVVDASGNVRGAGELVGPQSVSPQPESPAVPS